jgi:hypothetical protein
VGPKLGEKGPALPFSVPFPTFFEVFFMQVKHGFVRGHPNALFGEVSEAGWWWFFLAALPLKLTGGGLGLGLLALAGVRGVEPATRWRLATALAFPALLFVVLSSGRTQLGVRYLLPAWPGVIYAVVTVLSGASRSRRPTVGLAVVGAVESAAIHPHHLAFSPWWVGGPAVGVPAMPVGADWCQGRPWVERWAESHDVAALLGVGCGTLAWPGFQRELPCPLPAQVVAVHANELFRPWQLDPTCLAPLRDREPDAVIAHTIYVFDLRPGAKR